ncbi:hypothetical protein AAFO92_21615 [Roseovarius sp. CAU 1744]|uniref:hypothetical protein n=1 Tax=Roseovarius sp. CAU 1744 TaxID=3140368 RepID=UPI00325B2950
MERYQFLPKAKVVISIGLVCFLLALWSSGNALEEDEDLPDPDFLSTNLFFSLGNVVVSVPAVSIKRLYVPPDNQNPLPRFRSSSAFGTPRWFETQEYKKAAHEIASNPKTPVEVSALELNFGSYGSYGEYRISREICPKLTKKWSQKACSNQLRKELKHLPNDLFLVIGYGMEIFRHHSWTGMKDTTVGDLLDTLEPLSDTAKMACAEGQKYCRAAFSISKVLVAVWTPKCTKDANGVCEFDLEAEGVEIANFVFNELVQE